MVGSNGALSFMAKYKTQWNADQIEAFKTSYLALEESLPCSMFDYGFSFQFDEEGPGVFRTFDLGFKFAGTIPIQVGKALNNIRLGASLQWTKKRIDFRKFIFSDQLHEKYGVVNLTNFEFPDENSSLTFFTPSVGIVHRIILNVDKKTSPSFVYGIALHNSFSLGNAALGNVESILRNDSRIPRRWTAFGQIEIIPYFSNRFYLAIRPMLVYQKQSELEYWEVGSEISFNRFLTVGTYYHFNRREFNNGNNSNWFSFSVELGDVLAAGRRMDLGFSFSSNFSGLRNQVGPIFEFSIAYHLDTSPSCRLAGTATSNDPKECVNFIAEDKGKIYENIWFKTIHTKHGH